MIATSTFARPPSRAPVRELRAVHVSSGEPTIALDLGQWIPSVCRRRDIVLRVLDDNSWARALGSVFGQASIVCAVPLGFWRRVRGRAEGRSSPTVIHAWAWSSASLARATAARIAFPVFTPERLARGQ